MTNTGEIVRICRERLGWSRSWLGIKSGVSQNTIVCVENNKSCRVDTFEKLLDAMGYEIEILPKETRRFDND